MTDRTLRVDGMSCTGCEDRVETALAELDGVSEAVADHETGTVALELGPDADDPGLAATVRDLGYEPQGFQD